MEWNLEAKMDNDALLDKLNSAPREEMLRLPGIGPSLADQLIAARPFATLGDVTRVRGMTRQKLEHLAASIPAKEDADGEPEREAAQELTPIAVAEAEVVPAVSQSQPKGEVPKRNWNIIGRALGFLFRLLLALVILAGIAAAVYFGAPYVYEKYVRPVENNAARLGDLEVQHAADVERLTTQIAELQNRVKELEGRMDTAEAAIQTHTVELARLDELEADLQALSTMVDEQVVSPDSPLAEAQRQIAQLKILTLLSRSRLYLSQSNFGSARQDVSAARDLLAALRAVLPVYQQPAAQNVLERLDLALGNLPEFPVIAAGDVDIAWQLMLTGFPTEEQAAASTVTPVSENLPTPTPFPVETITPTPGLAVTPTLTPFPMETNTPAP